MAVDFQSLISSPSQAYAEGLRFFRGEGMINNALKRITADLEKNGIGYAVIGAVALNQHGYHRFTEDIDLLLTREGLEEFGEKLVGLGYRPAFEGAKKKFRTTEENIPVEIITTGEYSGDGKPKPVVVPDPTEFSEIIEGVNTISLEKLIELKLASGISAPDRLKDLADVQEMIRLKKLDKEFAASLDQSVREEYLKLWSGVNKAPERDVE